MGFFREESDSELLSIWGKYISCCDAESRPDSCCLLNLPAITKIRYDDGDSSAQDGRDAHVAWLVKRIGEASCF